MMHKTTIEWCDHSLNPIKGVCKGGCEYCYATRMYKRFKWDPEIRLDLSVFDRLDSVKAGSKVFLCSTHDMFGSWINDDWINAILSRISQYPELTFIVLTKEPQRLWKFKFPRNAWLGVTVESQEEIWRLVTLVQLEVQASVKFVSFEPLQGRIDCDFVDYTTGQKISWFIIGQETGNRKEKITVQREWVEHLINQHADTPVFLKDNLGKLKEEFGNLQEFPEER